MPKAGQAEKTKGRQNGGAAGLRAERVPREQPAPLFFFFGPGSGIFASVLAVGKSSACKTEQELSCALSRLGNTRRVRKRVGKPRGGVEAAAG